MGDPGCSSTPGPTSAGGVSERFLAATRELGPPAAASLDLLPARLAEVAQQVLGADAVALSLFTGGFRLPLGASGEDAVTVERLEFTLGEGPCWDAVRSDAWLQADEVDIRLRWPQFHQEMLRRTSVRSVISIPLRFSRHVGGAFDTFFNDPTAGSRVDGGEIVAVAAHVAETLNRAPDHTATGDPNSPIGPAWTRGPAARSRAGVWIATGMILSARIPTLDDALAVLRAVAYSEETTIDDVADQVVSGRRPLDQLRRPTP